MMNLYRRLARPLIVKTISVVRIAISINTRSRDVARKTTNRNRIRRVAKPLINGFIINRRGIFFSYSDFLGQKLRDSNPKMFLKCVRTVTLAAFNPCDDRS